MFLLMIDRLDRRVGLDFLCLSTFAKRRRIKFRLSYNIDTPKRLLMISYLLGVWHELSSTIDSSNLQTSKSCYILFSALVEDFC